MLRIHHVGLFIADLFAELGEKPRGVRILIDLGLITEYVSVLGVQ
jgi:hypothetical protein